MKPVTALELVSDARASIRARLGHVDPAHRVKVGYGTRARSFLFVCQEDPRTKESFVLRSADGFRSAERVAGPLPRATSMAVMPSGKALAACEDGTVRSSPSRCAPRPRRPPGASNASAWFWIATVIVSRRRVANEQRNACSGRKCSVSVSSGAGALLSRPVPYERAPRPRHRAWARARAGGGR